MQRNKKTFLDKATEKIAWLMGSWWGVGLHTLWFGTWVIFRFDMNLLTLWVSLEAIFLGIFLLMASTRAEIDRDRREVIAQKRQMELVKEDVQLDKRADRRQLEMLKELREIKKEVDVVKKLVKK